MQSQPIIPVPDTQPPIFLGHYGYPLADVTLNFEYLSPSDCPVSASQKLSSITLSIPRGGTILNALEIAANHDVNRVFQAQYLSKQGFYLSEMNLVPPPGANPLCTWSWASDPKIYPTGTADLTVDDVYIPLFYLADFEIDFTYQLVSSSAAAPESGFISSSSSGNNAGVSPCTHAHTLAHTDTHT